MRTCHATSRQTCRILAAALVLVLGWFPQLAFSSPQPGELKRTDRLDLRRLGKATDAERAVLRIEWRAGMSDVDADRNLAEMSAKLRELESGATSVREALQRMPARQKPAEPLAAATVDDSESPIDWRLMVANLTALVLVGIWWFARRKSRAEVAALEAQLNRRAPAEPKAPPEAPMEKAAVPGMLGPTAEEKPPDTSFDFDLLPPAGPETPPAERAVLVPADDAPAVVESQAAVPPQQQPDVPAQSPVVPPAATPVPAPPDLPEVPIGEPFAELAPPAEEPVPQADPVAPDIAEPPVEPVIEFTIDEPIPAMPAVNDDSPEKLVEFDTEIGPLPDATDTGTPPETVLEFSIDVDPEPSPAAVPPPGSDTDAATSDVAAKPPEATLQMAEIMLSMGLEEGAAQALLDYTQANPKHAIYHMLKLLGIYRQRGLKQEFLTIAEKLRKNFNIQAADWNAPDAAETPSLEKFSRVAEHVQSLWVQPTECIDYLRHLIEDNREGARAGFPQAVAEEILLLIDILQDSAAEDQAAG